MTRLDFAGGRDTTERLNSDDQATLREEQFLQAALVTHRAEAARRPGDVPGQCSNCGERCLPQAVYCDDDCKADHEHRLAVRSHQYAAGA